MNIRELEILLQSIVQNVILKEMSESLKTQIERLVGELIEFNLETLAEVLQFKENAPISNYDALKVIIRALASRELIASISAQDNFRIQELLRLLHLDHSDIYPAAFAGGVGFTALWLYHDKSSDQLLRLHVYEPSSQGLEEDWHNHKVRLDSHILIGELHHSTGKISDSVDGLMQFDCTCSRETSDLRTTNRLKKIVEEKNEIIPTGNFYSLPTGEYHKVSVNNQFTVSLCVFTVDSEDTKSTVFKVSKETRIVKSRVLDKYPEDQIKEVLGLLGLK